MNTNYIKTTLKEFLTETHLTYDEVDLDIFSNKYLVGKWFGSEKEAIKYLKSIIDHTEKDIEDFYVFKDKKDSSLKPYKIYPKPSDKEIKRNEASKFIKKYGILSSKDLRYVTYPLYAYVEYKHIDKIKELGVKYQFKPLNKINLYPILSRFIKEKGYPNNITDAEMKFYNYGSFGVDGDNSMGVDDIKIIKSKVNELLNEFNDLIGSDFYIDITNMDQTNKSLRSNLLNKLDDKIYNPNIEFDKRYKDVSFIINRGEDEHEFLAVIEMETIDKPKMI